MLHHIQTRLTDFSEYRTDAEKEFTTVSCLKTLLSEVTRHVRLAEGSWCASVQVLNQLGR
jgi:hypothetical protein